MPRLIFAHSGVEMDKAGKSSDSAPCGTDVLQIEQQTSTTYLLNLTLPLWSVNSVIMSPTKWPQGTKFEVQLQRG